MKWYTYEERHIKEGDRGLFYFGGENEYLYSFMTNGKIYEESGNISLEKIKCYIPLEELKLALPKDK